MILNIGVPLVILAGGCLTLSIPDFDHEQLRKFQADGSHTTSKEDGNYWLKSGVSELKSALHVTSKLNTNVAKNVIIFIGDGMSLPTVTAGRIYRTQYESNWSEKGGEEGKLTFEKFPHIALIKTYSVDMQTSDSACTASAIFSGIKTKYSTIGFDSSVELGNPQSQIEAKKVETVMQWAQDVGKDTGFVTTSRVSHATPAALYAHVADRGWECDRKLPKNSPKGVFDITHQLVYQDPGRKARVVMGGGGVTWVPEKDDKGHLRKDDYTNSHYNCLRKDGDDLISLFLNKSEEGVPGFEGQRGLFVKNRMQLMEADLSKADYLLGLFNDTHMAYEYERENQLEDNQEPALWEMATRAMEVMERNENGYFLMVESSNIDHAHHSTKATAALHEMMALDVAVEKVLERVNTSETLVIVTADHSHTMTLSGYQPRGSDIRGLASKTNTLDDKPIMTLLYGTGSAFFDHVKAEDDEVNRLNLTDKEEKYTGFRFERPSAAPTHGETHSSADVGIFAVGPYAHLFHSVHEQSYIAQVVAYSACMGPHMNDDHCHENGPKSENGANSTSTTWQLMMMLVLFNMATIILWGEIH